MVKVEVIRDDGNKRILRCSEGNRIWYQLWITDYDIGMMMSKIRLQMDFTDNKIIRVWLRNLQKWYVFFYEKKDGEFRGVVGKENSQCILDCIE